MPDQHPAPLRSTASTRGYWRINSALPGESSRLYEVEEAAEMPLCALIDEEAGGVVGYLSRAHTDQIVEALNRAAEPLDLGALDYLYEALTGGMGVDPDIARGFVVEIENELVTANPWTDPR